ncbi:hypothetical protein ALC62_08457 [Cyphomyrmex costatus]|uniref:Uncharacterized protein n=1 Tax=Cyphomyrmex costatus TaxID=456900 RepID=A0A195CL15_9HYME|nr:hypothetical protein ALC62_08457 [Cyphomyrmex costatus]
MDPRYPSGRPAADRAELTSPGTGQPPPSLSLSRSMVSETLVIVNVDVRCFVHAFEELTIADSVEKMSKNRPTAI